MEKVADLLKKRAVAYDAFVALADKETLTDEEVKTYDARKKEVEDIDAQIKRKKDAEALAVQTAQPVADQDPPAGGTQVREFDPYNNEKDAIALGLGTNKGLRAVALVKTFDQAGRSIHGARELAKNTFGERNPITRAFEPRIDPVTRTLITGVGNAGGYIVPPDYVNEIIELLRPLAVVRGSGARVLPMPRGTLTLPAQASAATASYSSEDTSITQSQQSLKQKVLSFKKLTALVPVSNDLMRYADPAADAFVRDDLVKIIALREDLAFLMGDGSQSAPKGMLYIANDWVKQQGGTAGSWNQNAASTLAVNAKDSNNTTGGNFITSTYSYTLATAASELGGAANRLDTANVGNGKRVWFMHPQMFNYLFNVQNSLGVYVYREELSEGKLLTYPVKKTTQIGTNWGDAASHTNTSFIFLADMDDAVIGDSMNLELMVSREGSYVNSSGSTVSALQSDETLIRAIAEHDFTMRHDQSVAVIQAVDWAPAIS